MAGMKQLEKLHGIFRSRRSGLIESFLHAGSLQRIGGIDMNCGMNYISAPLFRRMAPYSRLDHSINTAYLIARFTDDPRVIVSGLFHDISTPVFSHVIDFMNGDYEKQESTEAETEQIIRSDTDLLQILTSLGIRVTEVSDYHRYPIADNDTPKLSADRLEYSLSNMVNYGFADAAEAASYYEDLCLTVNEENETEIAFSDEDTAAAFTEHVLLCSKVYSSDLDRYGMEILSEMVRDAQACGAVSCSDLYTTEDAFIAKMIRNPSMAERWKAFRALKEVRRCSPDTPGCRVIPGKKRYIDPLVAGKGRISSLSSRIRILLLSYQEETFAEPVIAGGKENA